MNIDFTDVAAFDLEEIGDFIAKDNPLRAVTFVRELEAICIKLSDMPEAYPILQGYEARGVRKRVYRRYIILYIVYRDKVTILRVIHGARDYPAFLFKDETR